MATKKTTKAKSSAPKAPVDPASLRKTLLADPTTKGIAKNLGLELEAYVDQVVHFVMNPHEEPLLYIAEDEDLRAAGFEPPDEQGMLQYLQDMVATSAAAEKTEFTDPRAKLVSMDSPHTEPQVAGKTDPRLKKELDKQLRTRRGGGKG